MNESTTQESLFTEPRSVRLAAGRARRSEVPLEAHAELPDPNGRADPNELLTAQDEHRQTHLVPVRHGRMSATAFTFYRGAAAVMASDLARTPTTDLRVQLCGDAHLSNFGMFHSPDRRLVFDLNDFDETTPGPFEWDLKRLAASVTVAGRNRELSAKKTERATLASLQGYRETMAMAAGLSPLQLHYHRVEVAELAERLDRGRERAKKTIKKAARKNSLRALDRLTEVVDGRRVIMSDPPLITRVDRLLEGDERQRFIDFFHRYVATLAPHRRLLFEHYHYVDMAHKVVGVGSVGTRCLIVLLESGDGHPLFLQFKEATASVLEAHLGPSEYEQAGERVVQGQRLLQSAGDVFLGWSRYADADGRASDFYFRQLWDGKRSADIDEMGTGRLTRYARVCGAVLALAHARSSDPTMLSGYIGEDETLDHAIAEFAVGYADLTETDHGNHLAAIEAGRIEAVRDL